MDCKKIIEHFGAKFYDKVLVAIKKYAKQWNLSNFEQIDYYSINCLFTCLSTEHGACVLKIGTGLETVMSEYYMLKDFNGNGLCKVYESDIDNGILLIERIIPGTQLRDEPNQNIRLNEFCLLFQRLHKPLPDISKYLTYMDWVSNITAFMKTRSDYITLRDKMIKAEDICRYLWEKYTDRLLLHGDLHHDNVLLGKDGYCSIDPKGVVGDAVFDIPRFILNEDDWDNEANFNYIVNTISTKLNILEHDIRALFYVELCMAKCWGVEDGDYNEVDLDEVLLAERIMDKHY